MRLLLAAALLWTAAASPQARRPAQELNDSLVALAERLAPSVVLVRANVFAPESESRAGAPAVALRESTGSGVIVSADGYIITNAHVVAGAARIHVQLPYAPDQAGDSIVRPKGRTLIAALTGVDRETDLALLKIEAAGLPALPLGDSDRVRQGQLVLALGNPLGLDNSISLGVISAVARQLTPDDPVIYLQTDAAINPGNSGGPLVSLDGQVVGINTRIYSQSGGYEGLGFAVPSNIVRAVVDQLSRQGVVTRGDIGIDPQTITPGLAAGLALARKHGVVLADVAPNGPADLAGLQPGDIVLALNGKPMENARQLQVNLYQQAVGSIVRLDIQRGEKILSRDVVVTDRADPTARFAAMVDARRNLVARLGIFALAIDRRLAPMLAGLRRSYGIVVAALASTPTAPAGLLEPGDVIYQLGTQPVSTLQEFGAMLDKIGPGESVVLQIERDGKLRYLEATLN
jgi:serine protease Do